VRFVMVVMGQPLGDALAGFDMLRRHAAVKVMFAIS
jgi:hypothetical protein